MGLLNPLNLIYMLSLGALVLIYLRARSRPTIEVSSLMLFDEIPSPVASARHLRVDLMFWLELLALGALSMAAAGLYIRMPAAQEHVRRHALVFDLGAGMGARDADATRLEQARREALGIVAAAPAGDAFSVISYALEARVVRVASANRQSVRGSIVALAPLAVPARPAALSAALMRAREADTIDLFADRIAPGEALKAAGVSGRVRFHQVGSAADNLAIVSLDPGTVRASPGYCVIRSFSPRPHLCELAIDADGERVMRTAVMIEPRGQVVVPFGPLERGGLVSARITGDDALAADNQQWAYARSDATEKVLLVSPDASARDDLARVLLAVNQNFIITAIDAKKFEPDEQHGDFSLAVMHDFYDARIQARSRLLIYPPGGFAVEASVPMVELRDRPDAGSLAKPLMLGPARMLAIPAWMEELAGGAVAGSAQPIPLAAFGRDQKGAVGVIAFDVRDHLLLDPDRLDALVVAVDLVKNLVAPDNLRIVSTGSYVTLPATGAAHLFAPGGAEQTVKGDRFGRIRFRALEAGRYRIESSGRTVDVFANYFDAAESDLAAPTSVRLDTAKTSTQSGASALGTAEVRPLDLTLIALALLAFLIESAIILRNAAGWRWRHV